jgi:RimJ/RimL family protein N-acetyltransferase
VNYWFALGRSDRFSAVMIELATARLQLHPIDVDEAQRIYAGEPGPSDTWALGYPFEGDLDALRGFLRACEQHGDQRPFGYYRIDRRSDRLSVGGIGFMGRPDEHAMVEIGYGLAPSARGNGYAAEALTALVRFASTQSVTVVRADTDLDNIASQRTLERAGFTRIATDSELHHYEIRLTATQT